jgi:hypothetical protein
MCCFLSATLIVSDVKRQSALFNKLAVDTIGANTASREVVSEKVQSSLARVEPKNARDVRNLVDPTPQNKGKESLNGFTTPGNKGQQAELLSDDDATENQLKAAKKIRLTHGRKSVVVSSGASEEVAPATVSLVENTQLEKQANKISSEVTTTAPAPVQLPAKEIVVVTAKEKLQQKDSTAEKAGSVKKMKASKENRWLLGITFTAGRSSTASGYLASAASSSYADYAFLPGVNQSNAPGSNLYNASRYDQLTNSPNSPTRVVPGTGFTVGLTASKKLSEKSKLVAGVNYKLLNANKTIGYDSAVGGIRLYAIGNISTYHNQFHFIEIPLTVQIKIASIKQTPVLLEGGVTFSELISSNALQYDVIHNKYYVDNSLFTKTIIGLTAGFSVSVLNKQKPALLIGPQFYYSTTPAAGKGLYAKAHYSFLGIKVQKMLKKN